MSEPKCKVFKDPIYGYISLREDLCSDFIDTPIFQRLRRIEQTSMRILFPSAHHDRFAHSIGTYHLGQIAFNHLKKNSAHFFPEITADDGQREGITTNHGSGSGTNIVEASFILIHTLKNRSFYTIYDLVEKKYAIEKSIPSVYIDVSKNAIHSCVAHFPKIFKIDEDRIIKKDDASRFLMRDSENQVIIDLQNSIYCNGHLE